MMTTKDLLTAEVEDTAGYALKMAAIARYRAHLDELEKATIKDYKILDLPLWYVGGEDRGGWRDEGSPTWLLLREDANPEVMHFICSKAYRAEHAPAHPIYPAFYAKGYMLGNKVTEPKKYIKVTGLTNVHAARYWREYLTKHLGSLCWTREALPSHDVNNQFICR